MIDPNFFLGYPVPFGNLCSVYPPKMKDVLNNKNYPAYKKLFFSSQEDIEDEYTELKLSLECDGSAREGVGAGRISILYKRAGDNVRCLENCCNWRFK